VQYIFELSVRRSFMQPPQNPQPPYQPQPQYYQPIPPQPPARKPRRWPWWLAIVLVAIVFYSAGKASVTTSTTSADTTTPNSSTTQGAPQPTQSKPTTPPKALTWQTTHTFSGDGSKKTEAFVVGNDWKINWTCQGTDSIDAPLFLTVYNASDNSPLDLNIQTTCKAGSVKTTGGTEEHTGGNVYLDINSGVAWTLEVQELK
jgi:hypothetical protein